MDTIDLNALLKTIKKAVSDQNSQVPTILVTGDSKFLVDVIRAEYSSCYSVCGHPQDESKSYYFLKPAECDLYYFVYTRFNEFGDLQYAIDIATKGHKPSFIILDNNSEYKYFPKDILEKYPTFSVSLKNSLFSPLRRFVDSPNQELYLRECLKEAKGFELLSTYHQLISILIEKCSHSTSREYQDELEQLLVDTYQSIKVEEAKLEDSIILLLDIATRIRNSGNYNIKGYDGYFVKRAKELSVVSEVSADLAKQIEDMAKPYIEEENEFMMNNLNLDNIEYSDELKSNLII